MGTRHFWIRQAQHVIQLLFDRNLSKKQGVELSLQGTEWVGRGSSLPQGSSPSTPTPQAVRGCFVVENLKIIIKPRYYHGGEILNNGSGKTLLPSRADAPVILLLLDVFWCLG